MSNKLIFHILNEHIFKDTFILSSKSINRVLNIIKPLLNKISQKQIIPYITTDSDNTVDSTNDPNSFIAYYDSSKAEDQNLLSDVTDLVLLDRLLPSDELNDSIKSMTNNIHSECKLNIGDSISFVSFDNYIWRFCENFERCVITFDTNKSHRGLMQYVKVRINESNECMQLILDEPDTHYKVYIFMSKLSPRTVPTEEQFNETVNKILPEELVKFTIFRCAINNTINIKQLLQSVSIKSPFMIRNYDRHPELKINDFIQQCYTEISSYEGSVAKRPKGYGAIKTITTTGPFTMILYDPSDNNKVLYVSRIV